MLYYFIPARLIACLTVFLFAHAGLARADGLRVVADIPPVQSLVAQVLGQGGTVALAMPPGSSPHSYAMRPSEASALEAADLVVWVGHGLTPWLEGPVETLARDARVLELLEAPNSHLLPFREEFEADDHGETHTHDHGHGHGHGDDDPHAWLSPENGMAWLDAIADALSEVDPGNASTYKRNAQVGKIQIEAAAAQARNVLAPVRERPFIVYHDAFQYYEAFFDLTAAGAVSLGDAVSPGPQRLAAMRETVQALKVQCLFTEPQYNAGLVSAVLEGSETRTVVLDPLGALLEPGPDLYPDLLRQLARDFASCG